MGKPLSSNIERLRCYVGELTRGSETSQYPEEKKPKGIPPVAASEKGRAQTQRVLKPAGVALWGSRDITKKRRQTLREVTKLISSRIRWKAEP